MRPPVSMQFGFRRVECGACRHAEFCREMFPEWFDARSRCCRWIDAPRRKRVQPPPARGVWRDGV